MVDGRKRFKSLDLARWLIGYSLRRWRPMVVVLATMLVKISVDVLKPWPMKVLVDNALRGEPLPPVLRNISVLLPGGEGQSHLVFWCVLATVVLFLLGWVLNAASAIANIALGQRLGYDLAADLFRHLQQLSLRYHARKSVGDSIRRITTDSSCIARIVGEAILPIITSVCTLAAVLLVIWRLNWALSLTAFAVVPFMAGVLRRYAQPMLDKSYQQQEVEGQMYTFVEQSLSSIPIVQAFSREDANDVRFRQATNASLEAALASTRVQLDFKVLIGFTTAVGTAGVMWMGAQQVFAGQLSVGGLLVFLSYLGSFYAPLESLAYTSSTIQSAAGSAQRVREILDHEPEVKDLPGASALDRVRGEVRLEAVTFGYEPGRPVLHGVNVTALPGQTIALVGPTGAGKSTLVSLIPRFFDPWAGRVTLDGRDLREIKLRDLRANISLVLQEPFLFPETVAANIAYGRPGASREQIEAAARAANAHEFIQALTDGYDSVIGERGATLSGGERQRISIARALLKDAPVLILDEPTSALDAQTEHLLVDALHRLMRGRTTFIIAHRLSTIRHADHILVLDAGAIVEEGTHQKLIAGGGMYARFWSGTGSTSEDAETFAAFDEGSTTG